MCKVIVYKPFFSQTHIGVRTEDEYKSTVYCGNINLQPYLSNVSLNLDYVCLNYHLNYH